MKVGVIGLGKLGVCMASVYTTHGYEVVGVDINEETISYIKDKQVPVEATDEKGLRELLRTVLFSVSTDHGILKGSEIIFVIVPTTSYPCVV